MNAGSFTQLVWTNTRQLGIDIVYDDNGRSAYVVIRYSPSSNYENVFPAKC
jgi:hypothetical protein